MAEMSRIHDALGHKNAPQKSNDAGQPPGQLSWAPGSRTTRRRESHGLGHYLLWGVLIGGLVWVGVGLWLVSGGQSTSAEQAAGDAAGRAEPTDAPEPLVVAEETQVASDPPAEASSVPEGASPPDEPSAPSAGGDTIVARLDDQPPAPPLSLPVISAILLTEGRRLAVIDGRVLGPGQRVGSWELVSVDRDRVVLRDTSGVEQV